jgi:hypothetical protein
VTTWQGLFERLNVKEQKTSPKTTKDAINAIFVSFFQ